MVTALNLDRSRLYELFTTLDKFFTLALQLPVCKEKRGGYFCMTDNQGFPLLIVPMGLVPEAKAAKYLEFAQEKARRLATHWEHQTSWESRDPSSQKWGGAVRDVLIKNSYIYSFSGFPEQVDEAFMLSIAGCINPTASWFLAGGNDQSLKEIYRIAEANQNPYLQEIINPTAPRGVMI